MNKEKYINSLYFRNNIRVLDERQLKEMYDKAFEKIECFYDIRFAGGIGAENQCALEKGDSCVRNGH